MTDLGHALFEYKLGDDRVIALAAVLSALLGGAGTWALNTEPPKVNLAIGPDRLARMDRVLLRRAW